MTKTCQDNNLNYINFLVHFYEYLNETSKYLDVTCIILKLLTRCSQHKKATTY